MLPAGNAGKLATSRKVRIKLGHSRLYLAHILGFQVVVDLIEILDTSTGAGCTVDLSVVAMDTGSSVDSHRTVFKLEDLQGCLGDFDSISVINIIDI